MLTVGRHPYLTPVFTWTLSVSLHGNCTCLYLETVRVFTWKLSVSLHGNCPCIYMETVRVFTWKLSVKWIHCMTLQDILSYEALTRLMSA